MRRSLVFALPVALGLAALAPPARGETHGIVFTSALKLDADLDEKGGIYFMRADGSQPRKLTNFHTLNYAFKLHGLDLPDDHASCSPDGKKIAFTSSRAAPGGIGAPNDFQIYVMSPNGSSPVQLTNVPGRNIVPVFSPDGTKIAFASERAGGVLHVFVMNADGTNVRQLTSGADPDSEPAWSPDGTRIAFTRIPFSALGLAFTQKDVWIVNVDGTGLRKLTDTLGEDHDPSFSPDGTKIAYSSERTIVPSPPFGDTFIIDVAKGTADDGVNLTSDLAFGAGDPAWHPDGSRIAFFKALLPILESPMQIWTMKPDGSDKVHVTHLLPDGILNIHPSWCKLADGDADGRPDYLENQNQSYAQTALRDASALASSSLGAAVAYADLTHDGRPDLAVAMPVDRVSGADGAGRVMLARGSNFGPDLDDRDGLPSALTTLAFGVTPEPGGDFGRAMVGCDFDGDGFSDLAIGAPGQDKVFVLYGKSGPKQVLSGAGRFGSALAAGDFDGDGRCDLAVGSPKEVRTPGVKGSAGGAVRVYSGVATGLKVTPQVIDQGALPIPADVGGVEGGDDFGAALAAGRLGADAAAELVIGAPGEGVAGVPSAGVVHVVPGVVGGNLDVTRAVTRDARSLPSPHGGLQASGRFGEALAVGKFAPTLGPVELVVGAPRHDVGGVIDAGLVATYSTSSLLATFSLAETAKVITMTQLGGAPEAGAQLGQALAVGDASGDTLADLAIAAPGATSSGKNAAGVVFLVLGSSGSTSTSTCSFCVNVSGPGVAALSAGLSPQTAVRITQAAVGEVEEAGDRFGGSQAATGGTTLAFGDVDGDGQADLLVGSPDESVAMASDGLVSVRYGLRVGVSTLSPARASAAAGETVTYTLDWKHPVTWRTLDALHVRFATDEGAPLWIRFRERGDDLLLGVMNERGVFVEGKPGESAILTGPAGSLDLTRSKVVGSGAEGPTVSLTLAVALGDAVAGRELSVELLATDDLGHTQGFERAGALAVGSPIAAGGACRASRDPGAPVVGGVVALAALGLAARRRRAR